MPGPIPRPFSWAAAAAALLLAGCASMAPPHQRPPLPVADHYPVSAPAANDAVDPAALHWREYFADPQLHRLIDQALAYNRDLRGAALRVQEARAAHGIQRAAALPELGLGADAVRARTPGELSFGGQPVTAGQYQVALGVNAWELDFWGRVRSLQDAALQAFLASEQAHRAVALMLVTEVAQAYYGLRELDERIALAGRTIDSRRESLRIFNRRFEVGAASRLELTQVQTLLNQAQTLGVQLQLARERQLHALGLLVGAPVQPGPAPGPLDDAALTRELRPGLPSELLVHRPDVLAAEHRLRSANADIGAARAAFFPRIALTGSAGTASAQLGGLFDGGSGAWRFAPSLSLPIFDGGRRQAGLDLAEVRRDQAVAAYEQTVQTAFREVSDALSTRRWLATQLAIEREALAAQTERARLAKLRYDSGAAAFLEVLDAQRDLLAAEQQLAQTRRALISARVALYAALGGGGEAAGSGIDTNTTASDPGSRTSTGAGAVQPRPDERHRR